MTDFLAAGIKKNGTHTIGLIAPKVTMRDESPDFFCNKMATKHGHEVVTPPMQAEIDEIERAMFQELAKGKGWVRPETKQMVLDLANKLIARAAEALILGSTNLGFVLDQQDFGKKAVPVFDVAKFMQLELLNVLLRTRTDVARCQLIE